MISFSERHGIGYYRRMFDNKPPKNHYARPFWYASLVAGLIGDAIVISILYLWLKG